MAEPTTRPAAPSKAMDWQEANARFVELRRTGDPALRDQLIEANLGLAHHLAGPYERRGIELEDLHQVALVGLVKAIDRFNPEAGTAFASFARRYIVGEIRHHFRDLGWDLKVPRGIKQLYSSLGRARQELTAQLGHEPTVDDLAMHLDVSTDEVIEALDAGGAYEARSLDRRKAALGSAAEPVKLDDGFLTVERRALLAELLEDVEDREREILRLRFEQELSQEAIAEKVGVSQVHVGRLLRATLADLRERLREDEEADNSA